MENYCLRCVVLLLYFVKKLSLIFTSLHKSIVDLAQSYGDDETIAYCSFGNRQRGTTEYLKFIALAEKNGASCKKVGHDELFMCGDIFDGIDIYMLTPPRTELNTIT